MDIIDLGRLTPPDFEALCKDLLEAERGLDLEIFGPGADGGVDLRRLSKDSGSGLVAQCKHYFRSGTPKLISDLKKEKAKVAALKPTSYILLTSAELTPANKRSIKALISPWIRRQSDILGGTELISLLSKHEHIVRRHVRLWLSSGEVLQALVNNNLRQRAEQLVDEAKDAALVYVPNPSLDRARDVLAEHQVCLISGIPGIGKSTLAMVLAATYNAEGWEIVNISTDVDEGYQAWSWNEEDKQFFYYDDFLGQTSLDDKLNKNEDQRLLSFMRRVSRARNKRFVLTTREYILEHAKQRYSKIKAFDFDPFNCVVEMTDYGPMNQARLLYNHLYFAGFDAATLEAFADPDAVRRVVAHKNFSPRLIGLSLEQISRAGAVGSEAVDVLAANLDNPAKLWEGVVDDQLGEDERALLEVMRAMPVLVALPDVELAWRSYREQRGEMVTAKRFRDALRNLEGSLVRTERRRYPNGDFIQFNNPSIRDYLAHHLAINSPEMSTDLIGGAVFYEQIETLVRLQETELLPMPPQAQVLQRAMELVDAKFLSSVSTYYQLSETEAIARATFLLDRFEPDTEAIVVDGLRRLEPLLKAGGSSGELINLGLLLHGHESAEVSEIGSLLLDAFSEYLIGTASSLFRADDYLDQGRMLVPYDPEVETQLIESFDQAAIDRLEELMGADDADFQPGDAYELLAAAADLELPDLQARATDVDRVRERVEAVEEDEADPEYEREEEPDDDEDDDLEQVWQEIDSMFETLLQD